MYVFVQLSTGKQYLISSTIYREYDKIQPNKSDNIYFTSRERTSQKLSIILVIKLLSEWKKGLFFLQGFFACYGPIDWDFIDIKLKIGNFDKHYFQT